MVIGIYIVKAEGIVENFLLIIDRIFNRTVDTECNFCHAPMTIYRTIFNKTKGNQSCSDKCTNIML